MRRQRGQQQQAKGGWGGDPLPVPVSRSVASVRPHEGQAWRRLSDGGSNRVEEEDQDGGRFWRGVEKFGSDDAARVQHR
ncbi:hypothetical protein F1880_004617 [Penicillium rolfsii]|nr:hypothetical protein F1880_004617 [Penicillium rolfsii]